MLRIVLALFIMAHGLVHAGLAMAPNPADEDAKPFLFFTSPDRSWILSRLDMNPEMIKWLGIGLVALSTVGFLLSGLGVFGLPGLAAIWRVLAIFSSLISLLLLVLFWHKWLPVGVLINVAVLFSLLLANWPADDLIRG